MRKCNTCNKEKQIEEFSKNKNLKEGREYKCKLCHKEYQKINKHKISQKKKEYDLLRRDNNILYWKERYFKNKEYYNNYSKNYYQENKEELNKKCLERFNKRYQNDKIFRLSQSIRKRTYDGLKGKYKSKKTEELLGCTFKELKIYIEIQFKSEMSWNNWGEIWELDHILPITSFNLNNENEQLKCFNYINLQPLFKTTEIAESFGYINQTGNRNKHNKI